MARNNFFMKHSYFSSIYYCLLTLCMSSHKTKLCSCAVVPHTKLELKTYFYGLSCFYISKKGKTLLKITSNLQLHVPCFWKHYIIFVVWVVNHCITCTALTPSLCAHNPERIFQFWERTMWMFQPTIDLDSLLRAILPVEWKCCCLFCQFCINFTGRVNSPLLTSLCYYFLPLISQQNSGFELSQWFWTWDPWIGNPTP